MFPVNAPAVERTAAMIAVKATEATEATAAAAIEATEANRSNKKQQEATRRAKVRESDNQEKS